MTPRDAVEIIHRHSCLWKALLPIALVTSLTCGCKSQQTQSQPPAMPSPPSSSSSSSPASQSQSQSQSQSSSSSQSSSQSSASTSGQPSSNASSQPSANNPTARAEQSQSSSSNSTASNSGAEAQGEESAGDGMPDPSGSNDPSSPVYSDPEQTSRNEDMPSDPSSGEEGSPPEDIDFSEEEQSSSSSSAANSASSSNSGTSQSSAPANSTSEGQPGGGSPRSGSAPNESPASSAERVAELEGQFESTMVSYDGMILRERDFVRNKPGSASADSEEEAMDEAPPAGASLEDLIQSAEAEIPVPPSAGPTTGKGPKTNNSSGQITGPGLPGSGRKGDFDHSSSQAVIPADIPSGTDDDVVARQIREAATLETDPELREKLWEEYRKYKSATQ
ncbi:hypothetical protein MO867_02575 [Microbulbifer sp. OS29]|uniref:Uncharacterized protein n=1 Tax=Microbulbifer okhotskensis TaxID=2926617 RepID=A0A9X2EPI8_9GAMM|nr:hypothetical protein [Microbulbifer okhotskensis]MCO1333216.1 hypothetical protein [Microbulbifer okhotskensis]